MTNCPGSGLTVWLDKWRGSDTVQGVIWPPSFAVVNVDKPNTQGGSQSLTTACSGRDELICSTQMRLGLVKPSLCLTSRWNNAEKYAGLSPHTHTHTLGAQIERDKGGRRGVRTCGAQKIGWGRFGRGWG
ncbi:hypothetical protein RRG08_014683 [Elysia crispata]|uniref:Uncharacterized protein n=1 Tax=Elysia crispata TaxID=231223 RepID=A0AAE1CYV9_9GAST|nr:hypothetical protein RRG08_014683 [Elysia crispata]